MSLLFQCELRPSGPSGREDLAAGDTILSGAGTQSCFERLPLSQRQQDTEQGCKLPLRVILQESKGGEQKRN